MQIDKITPHHSVGSIILGSSEMNVTQVLGDGYIREVEEDEFGDPLIEFPDLGVHFTFCGDYDFRLGCIGIERTSAIVGRKTLHGKSRDHVEGFVAVLSVAE